MRFFRRILAAERGTIMVMAAFALTAVMGMTGLAVEVGNGYSVKIRDQRVADMAALGAAQAYQANQSTAIAIQVAKDVVAASGLPTDSSHLTVTAPVKVNAADAVQVTIVSAVPVRLAQVVMNSTSYNVTASAAASLTSTSVPGCITALSGAVTYGVSLTGGTRLAASGCAVVTNSGVSATSGTAITAAQVVAGKTVNDEAAQWGTPGITTTPTAKNIKENKSGAASDTVGTDSRVVAGFAKVGYADPVTAPGNGAQAYNFDSNHSGAVSKYWNGGTGSYTLPAGTYDMTSMSVSTPVTFQNNAIIHVSGNISVGGGMKLAIGNNASLDVGGSITLGGSATMTVASGNVTIGKDASGFAINTGGSAVLSFGDGTFSANGNITTGGASSIGFGVTKYHYINGTLTLNGSASFGAGGYFINGNFVGTSGGNITGSNVTFFLAGALQGSGASIMNLSAPTDDNGGGVTDLLFATKSSAASSLGAGSSAVYGGMIYAPNSDMSFSGAATANGGSRCFSVVVSTFTMSGGSATGSACTGIGSGGSGSSGVRLLQ